MLEEEQGIDKLGKNLLSSSWQSFGEQMGIELLK